MSAVARMAPTIAVLVVHGTSDTVIPVEDSADLAKRIGRCTHVTIPGASHFFTPIGSSEEAELFRVVVDWLRVLRGASAL